MNWLEGKLEGGLGTTPLFLRAAAMLELFSTLTGTGIVPAYFPTGAFAFVERRSHLAGNEERQKEEEG